MLKHYIEKCVKKMSINDVYKFAKKNNIELTDNEANVIFEAIKEDWETLVFGNHNVILDKNKNKLNENLIKKIEELIVAYKNKYSELL